MPLGEQFGHRQEKVPGARREETVVKESLVICLAERLSDCR